MFGSNYYYFNTTRKYVIAFGNMFKGLKVRRYDETGTPQKELKIALSYSTKQNFIERFLTENEKLSVRVHQYIPRITFFLSGMEKDETRQLSPFNKIKNNKDGLTKEFIYNPVPYNFNFDVTIWVKNVDDGFQIIEQIIPFFQPSFNVTIKEFPEFNIKRDVPIYLNNVDFNFEYEYDEEGTEVVMFDLSFRMAGYIYPPIKESKLIKHTKVNMYEDKDFQEFLELLKLDVVPETAMESDNYKIEKNITGE